MNQAKCPICGKPTRVWYGNARKDGLCAEHADMLKAGEIEQCEKCGKYHKTGERCAFCTPSEKVRYTQLPTEGFSQCVACGAKTSGYAFCRECFHKYSDEEMLDILNKGEAPKAPKRIPPQAPVTPSAHPAQAEQNDDDNDDDEEKKHPFIRGKCLVCGYDSGENYLCTKCYYKYKEKTLLVKITKCQDVELTDESYESIERCKDGHMVKSQQEARIDDYLTEHGIRHAYERTLIIKDDDGQPITLRPDFCLLGYLDDGTDVWLEHWGINEEQNQKYKKTKKYKLALYKRHLAENSNFTLITTDTTDMHDLHARLDWKLSKNNIIPGTIDGKKE